MTQLNTAPTRLAAAVNGVFRLAIREVAGELAGRLGLKLTAGLANVTETRRVSDWISGQSEPRRAEALKAALQATRAIAETYGNDAARSWFVSTNPGLGLRSPLVYLRAVTAQEELDRLVACAVHDAT